MPLEEVGVRLSLKDRVRFGRDARGAAQDVERIGDAADKAGRELGQAERKAARAGRAFGTKLGQGAVKGAKGLGRFVGFAAKAGPLALGGLAVGAAAGGRSLLGLATQLEATGNKARTVFGPELGSVTKWAESSAEKMGLTTNELVGMGAGFADLLVPMGFTRKRASELTQETLGLTGALAQWSGGTKSAAEVSDILVSAMLGETDALKGLGIGLAAADVEARLAAKGQNKLTGQALEQARALAVQELLLSKSTDAQVAYAEGANRLGITQARLSARWKTFREQAAQRFAPHALRFLTGLTERLPMLQKAAGDFVRNAWPPIRDGFRALGESFGRIGDKLGGVTSQENKAANLGETIGTLIGRLIEFAGRAAEVWVTVQLGLARFGADLSRTVGGLLGWLAGVFEKLGKIPGSMGKQFRDSAEAMRTAERGAKQFAGVLDDLAKPRTVTFTTVYRELTEKGYSPTRAAAAAKQQATGGRLTLGRPTLVGERGPELIVPQQHGFVLTAQRTAAALGPMPDSSESQASGGAELAGVSVTIGTIVEARDPRNTYAQVRQAVRDELARR